MVAPLRIPCTLVRKAGAPTTVALPPMVHGLQFACVMLNVQALAPALVTGVNVALKAESDDPAMVMFCPGPQAQSVPAETVATLLETEIVLTGTAAPGVVNRRGGPRAIDGDVLAIGDVEGACGRQRHTGGGDAAGRGGSEGITVGVTAV